MLLTAICFTADGASKFSLTAVRSASAETLQLKEEAEPKKKPLTAAEQEQLRMVGALYGQAGPLMQSGKVREALALVKHALAIREKVLGEHADTATSHMDVGGLQYALGEYKHARAHVEHCLIIRRKVLGRNDLNTALTLNHLGILLANHLGEPVAARPYLLESLNIRRKVLGNKNITTAESLLRLGGLLHDIGDYTAARPLLEQGLAIQTQLLGDGHPLTAWSRNQLGVLLQNQGDYATARTYYEKALQIRKKALGDSHVDTAGSLLYLGSLLLDQGNHAGARPYIEQALAIYQKAPGNHTPRIASSLDKLGVVLTRQGKYAKARVALETALDLRRKMPGDNRVDVAGSLFGLGILEFSNGDLAESATYLKQALATHQKVMGEFHPHNTICLKSLGDLMRMQGDFPAARTYYENALAISRRNLRLSAAGQSERQQLLMSTMLRVDLDGFLSLPAKAGVTASTAYGHVLAWKGSILARQLGLRLERSAPELAALFKQRHAVAARFATLSAAVPASRKRDTWKKQLQELSEQKETLERELAGKSPSFRQAQETINLTPQQLGKLLPPGTVLVDFLVYQHRSPDAKKKHRWSYEQRLTAFVLKPGKAIARFDLGPMRPIEKAIDQWRTLIKQQPAKDHPGTELRRRLWLPLEKQLAEMKTVLISPDGALGRLPFAALPGREAGSYLLEDVALSVIPVPRLLPELLGRVAEPEKQSPSLLLVGDVDFDAKSARTDTGSTQSAAAQSGPPRQWQALSGTRGEILSIRDTFERKFRRGRVSMLREEDATDTAVAEEAGQSQYLHIATHGFFAGAKVRTELTANFDRSQQDVFGTRGICGVHPGLLSGLVLAGANRPFVPNQNDGVLTAMEIAEVDLHKVDLAVLSACETGLGRVAGGEGVLGLGRAFQVAGAKSVVTSLWKIPDAPTRVLMERFYANLWHKKKSMSRLEALREAQLHMLREGRTRGFVEDDDKDAPKTHRSPPYYWAAFVLNGDWR